MGTSLQPIVNWPKYNKSLINRGSLTFWVDAEAMRNWFQHDHHGRQGLSQRYTDQTICTFLMLKRIFNITLRTTQGLLDSLFELRNVPLCDPDYSCVSKHTRCQWPIGSPQRGVSPTWLSTRLASKYLGWASGKSKSTAPKNGGSRLSSQNASFLSTNSSRR